MGLRERFRALSDSAGIARLRAIGERRGPAARKATGALWAIVVEIAKLLREVGRLVAELWLGLAELAGRGVLAVWLVVWPVLLGAWRVARAALALAQRRILPAHATIAISVVALAALAASQWVDYRGVAVGTTEYSGGVELVAPAPEVEREQAGSAHSWVVLPIAAAGLVVVFLAAAGRRALSRLLVPLGLAVIAISIFIDRPNGLDEGAAAVAYEGVRASLLEGFWAQTVAAGVLVACGLLLPSHLSAAGMRGATRRDRSPATRRPRSRPRTARA